MQRLHDVNKCNNVTSHLKFEIFHEVPADFVPSFPLLSHVVLQFADGTCVRHQREVSYSPHETPPRIGRFGFDFAGIYHRYTLITWEIGKSSPLHNLVP